MRGNVENGDRTGMAMEIRLDNQQPPMVPPRMIDEICIGATGRTFAVTLRERSALD